MKTNFNRNAWSAELDNDAIRAIRFCNGFNTDLRVSLTNVNKKALFDWLCNNEIQIFGVNISPRPDPLSEEYDSYENMIWHVVRQIVR